MAIAYNFQRYCARNDASRFHNSKIYAIVSFSVRIFTVQYGEYRPRCRLAEGSHTEDCH